MPAVLNMAPLNPMETSTPENRWTNELTREQERYHWAETVRSYKTITELQNQKCFVDNKLGRPRTYFIEILGVPHETFKTCLLLPALASTPAVDYCRTT